MMTDTEADDSAAIADAIRRELSLGDGVERFPAGSVPVFAVGDAHVIKLFPSAERSFFETERAALSWIDGRLSIPTPRLAATGERGRWLYLVMTRLSGRSLSDAWPAIDGRDRLRLMREVGAALAEMHAMASEESDAPDQTGRLAPLAVDWPRFVDAQRTSCRERQRAKGLGLPWLDRIDDFLAVWTPRETVAPVLLHTEIMREHLLVERRGGDWRISGLVDFEPAMLGAREYEWASAGIFLTCAEPCLFRALLEAYGAEADDELPLRIMAYSLLHRYSNLRWYLERLPVPGDAGAVGDLERLARRWFTP